jgi:hypothetical protein
MLEDDKPYEGLKLDLLDLIGLKDQRLYGVLTDFQTGQLIREHVHGLRVTVDKLKFAIDHKIKRSRGCKICFYTGFQMGFTGFGATLDPSRECGYCTDKRAKWEPSPEKFWYYFNPESPDKGAVFPFRTEAEAKSDARYRGVGDVEFAEREATEEEQIMIDYGRQLADPDGLRERIRKWAQALDIGDGEGDTSNVRDEMFELVLEREETP